MLILILYPPFENSTTRIAIIHKNYSHLSNKSTGWNKRVLRQNFFVTTYMKKRLLLHRNKRARGVKAQKPISEAARLLDR
jgi:hypothetical protein